jgi:tetratricopeptide (TPR) repeat protein
VAAVRARREPLVPFAAAAFVAWLVHAGVDWDWEIPAVTLPALACAAVICNAVPGRAYALGTKARIGIGTAAAAIAVFGIVAGIGNQALASSQNALNGQNYAKAETDAKKAARWAPWLADPWIIQGQIAALGRDVTTARRDFRKAIAKDPHDYLAWYGLAAVETGKARRQASAKVVALNPLSDEANELRARP